MKNFVLMFRMDLTNDAAQPDKKQMQVYMQQWMLWINSLADRNRLADGGNHLSRSGCVLKPGNHVVETPYVADNMSVAGYIIIRAKNMAEATKIAGDCPILKGENTSVEIRETASAG